MMFQIACPTTHQRFACEVEVDEPVLRMFWGQSISHVCSACGNDHSYDFRQHYLAARREDEASCGGATAQQSAEAA